jgi:hypothetical protein
MATCGHRDPQEGTASPLRWPEGGDFNDETPFQTRQQ